MSGVRGGPVLSHFFHLLPSSFHSPPRDALSSFLAPLPPFAFSSSVDEFERERFSWRPPPQCRTSVSQAVTSLQRAVRPSVRPIVARSFVRLSVRLFVHPHEARELATAAAAAVDDVAVVHFEGRSPHS